jgi:hypothetical protein
VRASLSPASTDTALADLGNCQTALTDLQSLVANFQPSQDSFSTAALSAPSLRHAPSMPSLPPLQSSEDLQNLFSAAWTALESGSPSGTTQTEEPNHIAYRGPFSAVVQVPGFTLAEDSSEHSINDALRRSFDSTLSSDDDRQRASLDVPHSAASSFRNYLALGRPGVSTNSTDRPV